MTKQETAQLLITIRQMYPMMAKQENSQQEQMVQIQAWQAMLSDLDYKEVQKALFAWGQTETWPPTIADLRRLIAGTQGGLSASEAWGLLMDSVRRYGYYQQEKGLEALPDGVRRVAKRLGYGSICQLEERELRTMYAQFRDAYNADQDRLKRDAIVSPRLGKPSCIGNFDQREYTEEEIAPMYRTLDFLKSGEEV